LLDREHRRVLDRRDPNAEFLQAGEHGLLIDCHFAREGLSDRP
jgi:hypothetical protein